MAVVIGTFVHMQILGRNRFLFALDNFLKFSGLVSIVQRANRQVVEVGFLRTRLFTLGVMNMTMRILTCGLVLTALSFSAVGDDKHVHTAPAPTNAGLEKMKTLVGTWVMADKDGKPTDEVVSVVKVTAGGSAVHETLFPGQPHEMVSVYTTEGPDLVMTHYCMLGNQPRMKANTNSAAANKLNFEFAGGGNLDPKKDKHMHAATLTFVDADHIEINGIGWENGAPAKEMCNGMKLVRKK